MLRQTSKTSPAQAVQATNVIHPFVRILRRCSQMQRQVNRYH
ncbi:hypothetical protein [Ruegeria arenilitoris]|nr:hypothetical protein [Ruegeria arenilitoris]